MSAITRTRASLDLLDAEVRDLWPRLTRFYALSYSELATMPRIVRLAYAEALPALSAEEQLRAIEASAFPHLSAEDARAAHRHYSVLLERGSAEATPAATPEVLAGIGIAVEFVHGESKEEVS